MTIEPATAYRGKLRHEKRCAPWAHPQGSGRPTHPASVCAVARVRHPAAPAPGRTGSAAAVPAMDDDAMFRLATYPQGTGTKGPAAETAPELRHSPANRCPGQRMILERSPAFRHQRVRQGTLWRLLVLRCIRPPPGLAALPRFSGVTRGQTPREGTPGSPVARTPAPPIGHGCTLHGKRVKASRSLATAATAGGACMDRPCPCYPSVKQST